MGWFISAPNDLFMYALNARTGALLWSDLSHRAMESPAVANGVVYIGGGNNLSATNARTGGGLWM